MKKKSEPSNFLELMSSAIPQTIPFIKDYKALRHLKLSAQRHNLLLDILQYHYKGREYKKSNADIAKDLVTTKDNVSQIITFLKKENLIFNIQLSNKNDEGDYRGSNHTLTPNLVEIAQRILTSPTYQEQVKDINEDKIWEMIGEKPITEEIIEESSTPASRTEIIPMDNSYEYREDKINPYKLFLRYADGGELYHELLRDLDTYYISNERKSIDFNFLLDFFKNYMNSTVLEESMRDYINILLVGINNDRNKRLEIPN